MWKSAKQRRKGKERNPFAGARKKREGIGPRTCRGFGGAVKSDGGPGRREELEFRQDTPKKKNRKRLETKEVHPHGPPTGWVREKRKRENVATEREGVNSRSIPKNPKPKGAEPKRQVVNWTARPSAGGGPGGQRSPVARKDVGLFKSSRSPTGKKKKAGGRKKRKKRCLKAFQLSFVGKKKGGRGHLDPETSLVA